MLNDLMAQKDIASLTRHQKEFLVERIDHTIDTDKRIREIVASSLQKSVELVNPHAKVHCKD